MQPLSSVVDAIGQTPLVRLDRLTKNRGLKGTILAKLDYLKPGIFQERPRGKGHHRGGRRQRKPEAGSDGCRTDLRQHGDRSGDRLCRDGLSLCRGDVEGQFGGAGAHDAGAWRRSGPGRSTAGIRTRTGLGWGSETGGSGGRPDHPASAARSERTSSSDRETATRITTRPVGNSGTRAADRSMPSPTSSAPAAPMPVLLWR